LKVCEKEDKSEMSSTSTPNASPSKNGNSPLIRKFVALEDDLILSLSSKDKYNGLVLMGGVEKKVVEMWAWDANGAKVKVLFVDEQAKIYVLVICYQNLFFCYQFFFFCYQI